MTALPQDEVADLSRLVAELEQRLEASFVVYDDASTAFRTVLQKWPNSRKAPDAMLKLGFTQYELKKFPDARKTLQDVTQKYPDSDASRLAQERLKRIPATAAAAR